MSSRRTSNNGRTLTATAGATITTGKTSPRPIQRTLVCSSRLREQRGDAFPEIATQWSDIDGDGWGDNQSSSNRVDNFPFGQWNDFDGDGFGDNAVAGAYQPDACPKIPGTSTANDEYGCPDSDNDGVSDDADPCPWDPDVSEGAEARRTAPSPPTQVCKPTTAKAACSGRR